MKLSPFAAPLLRNARRLIGGPAALAETAFECETLCPGEDVELSPSIFLPGQIEKITGVPVGSSLQSQFEQVLRHRVRHAPTLAFHIKNATVFDGAVYAGRMKHLIGDKRASSNRRVFDLETGAVCSSWSGTKHFGHWLSDDALTYLLAKNYGTTICYSQSFPSDHKPIYEGYFDQDWSVIDRAAVEHLVVFQDHAQTSLKKKRQLELKSRIERLFPPREPRQHIYLKRNDTGVLRTVDNEHEIIDELSRRGFTILDIKTDSLEKILTHLVVAKIVVSLEGSHNVHGCYTLPAGSAMLFLEPANRFTATQRGWAENIGVKFGFVVGDNRGDREHYPLNDILKTIDLLM